MYKINSISKLIFDKTTGRHLWTFKMDDFKGISLGEFEAFLKNSAKNNVDNYEKIEDLKFENERFIKYRIDNLDTFEELQVYLKKDNK